MIKKAITIGIVIIFLIGTFASGITINLNDSVQQSSRGILFVGGSGPGNYTTIQSAINDTNNGDTVLVYNGTYYENVIINKSISLIGEDKNTTIIDGSDIRDVIYVTADWVNISGFTIQNGGSGLNYAGIFLSKYTTITDNIISNNGNGISGGYYCTIANNIISNNCGYGINLTKFAELNTIIDNNIDYNEHSGILLYHDSNFNIINSNNISLNYHHGIRIINSNDNNIETNNISLNKWDGIYLYNSSNNTIIINNIISNTDFGICLDWFSSSNNTIYHNNLINNTLQNAYDVGDNIWDDGYPSGGNYWDDYTGIDSDGDGIGDTPYNISGDSNQDLYPLMNQWGENPPVANFTHSGNESPILFDGSLSYDRDGVIVNWTWGFGDGTTGYGILVNHSYSATGIYNVMLTVTDDDGYKDIKIQIIEIDIINQPPGIPFINGPKFGKPGTLYPYTLISVDPEDEDVFYEIDWGDGSTEPWDGPYESNTLVNKAHEWAERGIYIIRARAKDENGTIGEWGALLVTMPRNCAINTPFLNWLHSHPNMFSIIQTLFQRFGL